MSSQNLSPREVPGSRVAIVDAPGVVSYLPRGARELGGTRVLLVVDPGVRDAGHAERAVRSLHEAKIVVRVFDGVEPNPTTAHVGRGLLLAREAKPDIIVALGGGSAMDCAKGVNFLYTNGGRMQDYWGVGKASQPMLPLIAIPTTTGTGSEAQSFALIADPETHQKMACGDPKALPKLAILDPHLATTQPKGVAAAAGIDAIAHAVETAGCTKRTEASRRLSREAWRLLDGAFERLMEKRGDESACADMQMGAYLAGAAIENSMLGAAHACANPLTARFGITHGVAVGLMLPHVVRFNAAGGSNPYAELDADAERLARRIEALRDAAGIPARLGEFGVKVEALEELCESAAKQWTATFNPRPVGAAELRSVYAAALG